MLTKVVLEWQDGVDLFSFVSHMFCNLVQLHL